MKLLLSYAVYCTHILWRWLQQRRSSGTTWATRTAPACTISVRASDWSRASIPAAVGSTAAAAAASDARCGSAANRSRGLPAATCAWAPATRHLRKRDRGHPGAVSGRAPRAKSTRGRHTQHTCLKKARLGPTKPTFNFFPDYIHTQNKLYRSSTL